MSVKCKPLGARSILMELKRNYTQALLTLSYYFRIMAYSPNPKREAAHAFMHFCMRIFTCKLILFVCSTTLALNILIDANFETFHTWFKSSLSNECQVKLIFPPNETLPSQGKTNLSLCNIFSYPWLLYLWFVIRAAWLGSPVKLNADPVTSSKMTELSSKCLNPRWSDCKKSSSFALQFRIFSHGQFSWWQS